MITAGNHEFDYGSDRLLSNAAAAKILDEVLCTNELPLWGGYIYWDYAESRIVEVGYAGRPR